MDSKSHPREHLRRAIDAEIESLKESDVQESIRALRQRRNALVPISSLPTEIIEDIFLRASAKRDDSSLKLAWLHVAHVCRQWREIALNHALFWSHINFANVTLAGVVEMLARAKNAPLHLEAGITSRRWDGARYNALGGELQAHASNMCSLSVIGYSTHFYTSFRKLVTSPAPSLEYLSLSHGGPVRVYLPETIFDGITPRLSCLELHKIAISWKSPLLKGLKYLRIHGLDMRDRPSLEELLGILDEMPELKKLDLHSASPIANRFQFDIGRTASLTFLTHLELSSTAMDCAILLAHLVLPALTSLTLIAMSTFFNGADVLILLSYVTQHAHGPQDTQPLQSALFHSEGTYTYIIAWPMPGISVEAHQHPWRAAAKLTARVALSIKCVSSELGYTSTFFGIIDAAIEALPLNNLVTLTAQRRTRLDKQIWLRHAPRWPLLEHVRLAPRAASGLREMLLSQDNDRESPLLPSLTRLDLIDDTALSARRTRRLCEALGKRVEQGVPLKVLDLRTCRGTISAVQLLGELVVDVQGPEKFYWSEEWPPAPYADAGDPETREYFVDDDDSNVEYEGTVEEDSRD